MSTTAYKQLAEYLAAAYIAHSMGIGLEYAHRAYVRDKTDVGGLWLHLAEQLTETMLRFEENAFRGPAAIRRGPRTSGEGADKK